MNPMNPHHRSYLSDLTSATYPVTVHDAVMVYFFSDIVRYWTSTFRHRRAASTLNLQLPFQYSYPSIPVR